MSSPGHRPGDRNPDDFDVLDGGRDVGRIYPINPATEIWRWGRIVTANRQQEYGDAPTRDDAMAAFRAEYERQHQE